MQKFSTKSTNRVLITFAIKSIIVTFVSIILFSYLSSQIIYVLDLSLEKIDILSLFICAISAIIISIIATSNLKNNRLIFGVISEIPLIFYTLINVIFNESSITYFFIKLIIIALIGALGGMMSARKSKSFKVK